MKFCADRVHGDLLVREHLSNRYLLIFDGRESQAPFAGSSHFSRDLYVLYYIRFVILRRTIAAPPPAPFTPTAGARQGSGIRRHQKGGGAYLSPSCPPVTKWRNDAVLQMRSAARTHPKVMRHYLPFSRPCDAPDRGEAAGLPTRRSRLRSTHQRILRSRSLHRGRAARQAEDSAEPAGRGHGALGGSFRRHPRCSAFT